MKWNSMKGYVLATISSLVMLTMAIVILLNLKNYCNWSLFGSIQYGHSIGAIMFFALLGGIVLWWMLKLMVWGVKDIRKGRLEAKIDRLDKFESTP